MEDILQLLSEREIVNDYEILSLLQDEDFYYLKIMSNIVGGSVLHIKIYLSDQEYNYSFHWQKESGELIMRWDNAPHHQEIRSFPHHVHAKDGVKESYSITLDDVLGKIKDMKQEVDR
jgi:hypothetical protein